MSEVDSSITTTPKQARTKPVTSLKAGSFKRLRKEALLPASEREVLWWEHDDCHLFIELPFAEGEDVASVVESLSHSGMYVSQVLVHCESEEIRDDRAAVLEAAGFDIGRCDYGHVVRRRGERVPDRAYRNALLNFIDLELGSDPTDEQLIEFAERFLEYPWNNPRCVLDDLKRIFAASKILDPVRRGRNMFYRLLLDHGLLRETVKKSEVRRLGDDLRERFADKTLDELIPAFMEMGYAFEREGDRWVSVPPAE